MAVSTAINPAGIPEVKSFLFPHCICQAGKGLNNSCKHTEALLFGLEEFTCLGFTRDVLTCTNRLQTWNQQRKKGALIFTVEEMEWEKLPLIK